MALGYRRILAGRVAAGTGFVCGLLGMYAGATELVWKFGSTGWFTGGTLCVMLAVFALLDGVTANAEEYADADRH